MGAHRAGARGDGSAAWDGKTEDPGSSGADRHSVRAEDGGWVLAQQANALLGVPSLLNRAKAVQDIINNQISMWQQADAAGVSVRKGFRLGYWSAWRDAIAAGLKNHTDDYEWLDL